MTNLIRIVRAGSISIITFSVGYIFLLLISVQNSTVEKSSVNKIERPPKHIRNNSLMYTFPDASAGINYTRSFPPDDTCFFVDKLSSNGMPTIHSAFSDPIGGYVVFIGLKFLADRWDRLNYSLDYLDGQFVPCDEIIKDQRSIGYMPQYILIITCPLPDSYREKKQFIGTLQSSENVTYEKITICSSGVSNKKRQFLSMCTMVRNVDSFVPGWLEFHRSVGVEHVYIYDNANPVVSTLPTTLKEYINNGYVTIIPWAHSISRLKSYLEVQIAHENDCIWRHKHDVAWLIKIDVDEYVQPMDPRRKNISEYLRDPKLNDLAAIRMYNWFFGRPKNVKPKNSTIIDRNTWRSEKPTMQNTGHDKNILKPLNVHFFKIHNVKLGGNTLSADPYKELRLVHYRADNSRVLNFPLPQFTVRDNSMVTLENMAQSRKNNAN